MIIFIFLLCDIYDNYLIICTQKKKKKKNYTRNTLKLFSLYWNWIEFPSKYITMIRGVEFEGWEGPESLTNPKEWGQIWICRLILKVNAQYSGPVTSVRYVRMTLRWPELGQNSKTYNSLTPPNWSYLQ
jgi:hypothetical protein